MSVAIQLNEMLDSEKQNNIRDEIDKICILVRKKKRNKSGRNKRNI